MSSSGSLHSHSGLERDLKLSKSFVLVDERFGNLFPDVEVKPLKHRGIKYLKVPIITFTRRGGVFKNNDELRMEWYENLKSKYRVRMIQRYIAGSRQVYQIKEHDGELWVTMNEALCIPCRMLNDEPIETLNKLRELYVEQMKSRL